MYLGLDVGTSGVKGVLCDADQRIVAQADADLTVSRPKPLWSEQDPSDWWGAVLAVLAELRQSHPTEFSSILSIGLVGQMHGAVLLDVDGKVLRPAILWNDGRSSVECQELEETAPASRKISGNIAMPGFTSPKLLWVSKNEPEIFAKTSTILLPKDYIRYCLTGEYVSEMSDAAGTLWLDVEKRIWSAELLAAVGLSVDHMPRLVEGSEVSGHVSDGVATECGLPLGVIVAGGAGDNAGGAIGIGAVEAGRAFLSLGTSGVLFCSNAKYSPNPENAVHAFCHCLPNTWHQMSVVLSAASCLSWVTKLTGAKDEASLLAEVDAADPDIGKLLFLPYLSGERTPHNDPDALGVFFGMSHDTDRAHLARAVLEGVAFAFADGADALLEAGADIDHISVIGGGARSDLWGEILATILNRTLSYHEGSEVGPAFGGARLARLAATGENASDVCTPPKVTKIIKPNEKMLEKYQEKLKKFRKLYKALHQEFKA